MKKLAIILDCFYAAILLGHHQLSGAGRRSHGSHYGRRATHLLLPRRLRLGGHVLLLHQLCRLDLVLVEAHVRQAMPWRPPRPKWAWFFAPCLLVLGSLWARPVWGIWWTWDARLTTTLVLWLIYVSYLVLRRFAAGGQTQVLAAAFAIFGFADVPIVYMSIRWFRTQHPSPVIGGGAGSGMAPGDRARFPCRSSAVHSAGNFVHLAALQVADGRAGAGVGACASRAERSVAMNPIAFLKTAYIVAWVVYLGYLGRILLRMKKVDDELKEMERGK